MTPRIRTVIAAITLALVLLASSWGLSPAAGPGGSQDDIGAAGTPHACPGGALDGIGEQDDGPGMAGCCIAFCQLATLAAAPALSPARPAAAARPLAGPAPPLLQPPRPPACLRHASRIPLDGIDMKKTVTLAALAGAAALAAGLAFWAIDARTDIAGAEDSPPIRLTPGDPQAVARGAEIYAAECASCHGSNLEGQPDWRRRLPNGRLPAPPHDPGGHTWHHPDLVLFQLTRQGPAALVGDGYQSDMPGYAGVLTDRQILDVLSYIKSTWPPEIQARHDRINAAAAAN